MKSKTQAGQTPIHSALLGGALSEMAKSRPKLDSSLGSEGNRTLEYYSAPLLQEPGIVRCVVSHLPSAFWHWDTPCPGRVLAQSLSVHHIATPITACSSLLPEFQPHRLVAECITTKACTSYQGISISASIGATVCCSIKEHTHFPLLFRALSVR